MNQTIKSTTPTPEQFVLQRRIGSTVYKVGIHFKQDAKETLNEKVGRLLINELQIAPKNVTMKPLQAGWLSERSSL